MFCMGRLVQIHCVVYWWMETVCFSIRKESRKALGEGRREDGLLLLLMEGADTDGGGGQRRPADQPELRHTEEGVQSGRL